MSENRYELPEGWVWTKLGEICKKLSQSILAKAFRGELVEQDPNDAPAEELLKRIEKWKKRYER